VSRPGTSRSAQWIVASATRTRLGDGRRDHALLLIAEAAPFTGVRIEPAHGQPRLAHAEATLQVRVQDLEHGDQALAGESPGHLAQRAVDGRERDAQTAAHEQHHRAPARELFEQLRMTGVGEPAGADDLLGERRGHHGVELAGQAIARGGLHRAHDSGGGLGARPARLDRGAREAAVRALGQRAARASHCVEIAVDAQLQRLGGERAQRGRDHLGADPCRIADGDADARAGGAGALAQRSSGATTSI